MSLKWLPNALTIARCVMAFVVGWAILTLSPLWAFALFLVTALSDFLDGYAARKLNAVSKFGAFLDPIADKLLVASALIAFSYQSVWEPILVIPTVLIVSRDIGVTLLRLKPAIELPVISLAKWKTAIEMVGLGCVLVALIAPLSWSGELTISGIALIWLAAILSAYTGFRYTQSALSQRQNDRA